MRTAIAFLAPALILAAAKPQIFSLAYSPDGKIMAVGRYKEVTLIDTVTRKPVATLPDHAETVRSVAFSKDGTLLAAAGGVAAQKR